MNWLRSLSITFSKSLHFSFRTHVSFHLGTNSLSLLYLLTWVSNSYCLYSSSYWCARPIFIQNLYSYFIRMTTVGRGDKCICSFTMFNPETVPYILMTKLLKKWKMAEYILSMENQWVYGEKAIPIHHTFDLISMTHIWDKIPWKNNLENVNIV